MIRLRPQHWLLAIVFTFVLYLVAAAALFWPEPAPIAVARVGVGGIEIRLGPSGGAPVIKTAGEPLIEKAQLVEQKQATETPEPMLAPKTAIIRQPEPKPTLKQQPKPKPASKQKPTKVKAESVVSTQWQADAEPAEQNTPVDVEGNPGKNIGSSNKTSGSNQIINNYNYMLTLQTWLERHKKYPHRAKRRHQQGTVLLYFVLDRQGNVIRHAIRQSSGYKLLDKEVAQMLKRAQPLPPLPASISGNQMEWIVPVQFVLR